MKLRKLIIEDYESLYKLWTNTTGMGLRSLDDSKTGIAKFLNRNPNTNYIATVDDEIVGVILSGHDGRRGFIYHTAVDKNFWGQGIGTKMVDAVLKALEEEGITKVALVAYKANDIGNSFWKSRGWEERIDLNYYNKCINADNK